MSYMHTKNIKDLKSKKVEEEKTTITKLESGLQDIMQEITKVESQIDRDGCRI